MTASVPSEEPSLTDALEHIYAALNDDNKDIDQHIARLKAAMDAKGQKSVTVDPARLVQNNRAGRKMMQSYFKRRGVNVMFG